MYAMIIVVLIFFIVINDYHNEMRSNIACFYITKGVYNDLRLN